MNANVFLQEWVESRGSRQLRTVATAIRLGLGRFEMHISRNVQGVLLASRNDRGSGALSNLRIDLLNPPQDLSLVLHGNGVLRGQVFEGPGAPSRWLPLLLLLAELDEGQGNLELPEPLASLRSAEGLGSPWAQVETDQEGRFEAKGLRPGAYVVRARLPADRDSYPLLLTQQAVLADGSALELHFQRPWLSVRLILANGRTRMPSLLTSLLPGGGLDGSSGWPSRPCPIALPIVGSGQTARIVGDSLPHWRGWRGLEFGFDVEPGRSYLVGAIGGGFDGSLQEVHVAPGGGRIDLSLEGRGKLPLGRVTVEVTLGGERLQRTMSFEMTEGRGRKQRADRPTLQAEAGDDTRVGSNFELYLERRDTGVILLRLPGGFGGPLVFEAPPGRYRVVAEGTATKLSMAGAPPPVTGSARAEITLVPGCDLTLQLELE